MLGILCWLWMESSTLSGFIMGFLWWSVGSYQYATLSIVSCWVSYAGLASHSGESSTPTYFILGFLCHSQLLHSPLVSFIWALNVHCICFGSALLCSAFGQQNSHQCEARPKPITTCMHIFSHTWRWLHVIVINSDLLIVLFWSVVIGWIDDCFNFGFGTLN